ncbi:HDOD domain-containing protein [Ramlibacter sp. AN1015]|uniref:EAL and HDOD domain-containing protein n=1 Tax=Ramlibacter sp. AN1015 TaxID=3133428 RepID=UPI0030BD5667
MPSTDTVPVPVPQRPDRAAAQAAVGGLALQALLDAQGALLGWMVRLQDGSIGEPLMAAAQAVHDATGAASLVWVAASLDALMDDRLDQFDPRRTVLQFEFPAERDPDTLAQCASVLAACRRLGFRVALAQEALPVLVEPALRGQIDLQVLHLPHASVAGAAGVDPALRPGLPLLVTGIDTEVQRALAQRVGALWFCGGWYTRPPVPPRATMRPCHAVLLELVALVRREAELAEIEAVLRRDPLLSLRFLRLINHCGNGLQTEVTSFGHAVMLLGLRKLLRWCCLLIATDAGEVAPAVGTTAVLRGRVMELLAEDLLGPQHCDSAFIAGMFSLLDVMTGLPIARALGDLPLPQDVLDVLRAGRGPLQPLLSLAISCERDEPEGFARACEALALSAAQVSAVHLRALAWTEELLERR